MLSNIFIIRIDMAMRMFHINIYNCVDYNLSIFAFDLAVA